MATANATGVPGRSRSLSLLGKATHRTFTKIIAAGT
jgi:hypothetical protein